MMIETNYFRSLAATLGDAIDETRPREVLVCHHSRVNRFNGQCADCGLSQVEIHAGRIRAPRQDITWPPQWLGWS